MKMSRVHVRKSDVNVRCGRRAGFVSSLLFLCFGSAAVAAPADVPLSPHVGFPEMTEFESNLLVGEPSAVRGTWRLEGGELTLETPHVYGPNLWFPADATKVSEGLVRMRLRASASMRATLLVRASFVEEDLERFEGYGVTINGTSVRLVRFDRGYARSMGTKVELEGLTQRGELEIVLTMIGSYLSAQLYDAQSLEPLAVLTAVASRDVTGRIGVKAGPGVQITGLSVGKAGKALKGRAKAMVGTRVVRIAAGDLNAAPEDFAGWIAARDGKDLFLRVSPTELARLERAGITPLSVTDHIPWRFIDPVYARTRLGEPPDSSFSYKNAAMVEEALRTLVERYPRLARMESLGTTGSGRDIWALVISDNVARAEREPAILIDGAQHGVELWATEYVLDAGREILRRYRREARVRRWVDGLEIWLVPLVNPDGRDAFMEITHLAGRKNYRDLDGDGHVEPREGVDLNRNFPFAWGRFGERGSRTRPTHGRFRGPEPASEPESRALMRLARSRSFAAAISVHTQGTVVLPPYATRGVKQPKRDEAWEIAQEMTRAAPRQMNGKLYRIRRRLYPVDGVWKDWLRYELGTVAMVVEGPFHNPIDPSVVEQSIEQSRALWQTLLDRTVKGPVLAGWVEDESGQPLAARVEVLESAPRAGERWLARRSDGFFLRYLIDDTPQTLRITAPGFEPLQVGLSPVQEPRRFVLTRQVAGAAH